MTCSLSPDVPACRLAEPPSAPLSATIGLARLTCIFGVVYVHAWTGLGGDRMAAQAGSAQDVLRWAVVELFGRSAVPLLSIVAGWLVAHSLAKRGAGGLIAGKARSVLAPMFLWNVLALLLVTGAARLGVADLPALGGPGWIAENLLNLSRPGDINVQTAFLRDLFVCMVATPLLVRLPARWLGAIMVVAAIWAIGGWPLYLLLRPSILLFFAAGILIRRRGLVERLGKVGWRVALLPFAAVLPFKVGLSIAGEAGAAYPIALTNGVDLLLRAAAALLVWRAMSALAHSIVGQSLLRLERYAFLLFCSHLVFMWLLAPRIGAWTGAMGSPGWPLFFLAQPLLALGFAIMLAHLLEAVSPFAAGWLSGGRLGRGQTASPAALPLAHAHWKL